MGRKRFLIATLLSYLIFDSFVAHDNFNDFNFSLMNVPTIHPIHKPQDNKQYSLNYYQYINIPTVLQYLLARQ
jgi:hypothetical protein